MVFFIHLSSECRIFFHVSPTYIALGILWFRIGWSLINVEKLLLELDTLNSQNDWLRTFIEQNFDIIEDSKNTKYHKDDLN